MAKAKKPTKTKTASKKKAAPKKFYGSGGGGVPRGYWKGHIRLSLVTFPVELYAAVTETRKIRLHKLSRETGERIHYKDSTESEGVISKSDIVKGYEYEKGHYVEIEDKELEKLKVESNHTIDLVQFTDIRTIDPIYFDKPYFIAPDGDIAMEAYVTLRDALRESGKVALGQITIGGRERIGAIKACGKGLIIETLRYNYEVREASKYFEEIDEDIKPNKDQVSLAQQLIKSKSGKFDPKSFKDTYQEGLLEIINAKLAHRKAKLPKTRAEPGNVVNIMDALKKSLAQSSKSTKTKKKTKAKTPAKKTKKAA
ncbi:MAG: Ku protein [Micavibrio aeruginosavorus]|uniref:Non-homologous end joining protein Ku n=1 Tax=Micavibrio aeruginosavorus TaxID=349221 RepID=A0A2W5HDA8_9BACT|nr:MAG: Ku protein [Micavibrio aeruginosavorus]